MIPLHLVGGRDTRNFLRVKLKRITRRLRSSWDETRGMRAARKPPRCSGSDLASIFQRSENDPEIEIRTIYAEVDYRNARLRRAGRLHRKQKARLKWRFA